MLDQSTGPSRGIPLQPPPDFRSVARPAAGPGIPPISRDEVLARVRSNYSGPGVAGEELMSIEVGEPVSVVVSR